MSENERAVSYSDRTTIKIKDIEGLNNMRKLTIRDLERGTYFEVQLHINEIKQLRENI